jgi:His/Glu/Gln/Arg/opine family amino acid ABC transporter permease subunit
VSGRSLIIATVLGIFVALLRISRLRVVRGITATYLWVMRGTPLLLVLFFIYYALPRLGISLPALVAAVVAMSLNATAYNAEIFRAGIQAISKGQTDAAHAIGMGYGKLMRRIILPQAARIVIPPYINNAILLVKNSALVSTITVADLMLNATQVVSSTFKALEIFSVAGVLYLTMTSALMLLQIWSERKFAYYVR